MAVSAADDDDPAPGKSPSGEPAAGWHDGRMTALSMSQAEREAFLAAVHVGVLAVESVDGPPVATPVWYLYEAGGDVLISTDTSTRKYTLDAVGRASDTVHAARGAATRLRQRRWPRDDRAVDRGVPAGDGDAVCRREVRQGVRRVHGRR